MRTSRFDAGLVVKQARVALESLPFSLEEWIGERGQDFTDFEDLDQPTRDDAFFAIGRLQGAAEVLGLSIRDLVVHASSTS